MSADRTNSVPPLSVHEIRPHVYAVIGDLGPQTYENDGLNVNLGFVVTDEGVIVIDTGPSLAIAQALHDAIRKLTSRPVAFVINTNSQNHRWLGNAYFRKLGVPILAHREAIRLMKEQGAAQLQSIRDLLKEKARGTELAFPSDSIDAGKDLVLGDVSLQIGYAGMAHTAGDMFVWMPRERVLFAGDIVYTERLLALVPHGNSRKWVEAFDKIMALSPEVIVPGHGKPTTSATAISDTRDYLVFLRGAVKEKLDRGISLQEAIDTIDQSAFRRLVNFELLARRNVHQAYTEMELE